jgi:putative transposase
MFRVHYFPKEVILQAVYFKLRLSYRNVEEILSIKKPVSNSWRMDETYIKVKGEWLYLYRTVDKEGNTVDFLRTKRRNKFSAHKFLYKAISNNGCPNVINIDKSGANKEAIKTYNKRCIKRIRIRQCEYLNNRVERGS